MIEKLRVAIRDLNYVIKYIDKNDLLKKDVFTSGEYIDHRIIDDILTTIQHDFESVLTDLEKLRRKLIMVNKKQICIDVEEYLNLVNAREKLILLECGGVDNWSWYSESLEDYKEAIDVKKVDGELVLEYYEDCDI